MARDKHTHTELIKTELGHALITGVPDRCNYVMEGSCFFLGNGQVLYEKDYRCTYDEATHEWIYRIAEERNTYVSGGSVCCIKCGKFYTERDIIMNF
jgi:hypothetical protein